MEEEQQFRTGIRGEASAGVTGGKFTDSTKRREGSSAQSAKAATEGMSPDLIQPTCILIYTIGRPGTISDTMANKKQSQQLTSLPTSRRGIEKQTGRTLSMRTSTPLARLRIGVKKQRQSNFFKLPPELRNHVYRYVFSEVQSGPEYPPAANWRRPGYLAPMGTHTSFLSTCRKIWLEAHSLPMSLKTPTFWFWNGPRDLARIQQSYAALDDAHAGGIVVPASETEHLQRFFKSLTPLNRTDIDHIQIFASEAWLGALSLADHFSKLWFAARVLRITIRESDWSRTGSDGVDTSWLEMLLASPLVSDLQELRLELEMKQGDSQKLYAVAVAFSSVACDNFTCNSNIDIKNREDVMSMTITWKANRLAPAVRKHARGYAIRGGAVEPFVGVPLQGKPQKRGGRRSQSVWRRNHWEADVSTPEGKKALRDGKAAALTEKWVGEGSLLCLV